MSNVDFEIGVIVFGYPAAVTTIPSPDLAIARAASISDKTVKSHFRCLSNSTKRFSLFPTTKTFAATTEGNKQIRTVVIISSFFIDKLIL
ncbi:MAG: hypothetical protein IIY05_01140 [Alistipes sp.]|nr:hypothetical protein [Alistipes sp.]